MKCPFSLFMHNELGQPNVYLGMSANIAFAVESSGQLSTPEGSWSICLLFLINILQGCLMRLCRSACTHSTRLPHQTMSLFYKPEVWFNVWISFCIVTLLCVTGGQ